MLSASQSISANTLALAPALLGAAGTFVGIILATIAIVPGVAESVLARVTGHFAHRDVAKHTWNIVRYLAGLVLAFLVSMICLGIAAVLDAGALAMAGSALFGLASLALVIPCMRIVLLAKKILVDS